MTNFDIEPYYDKMIELTKDNRINVYIAMI